MQQMHDTLRDQVRVHVGRDPEPTGAIIASQRVKTTEVNGAERGYDGGKKIKGRKRHILTDMMAVLLVVIYRAVVVADCRGATQVFAHAKTRFPHVRKVFADGGYRGTLETWVHTHCPWE